MRLNIKAVPNGSRARLVVIVAMVNLILDMKMRIVSFELKRRTFVYWMMIVLQAVQAVVVLIV